MKQRTRIATAAATALTSAVLLAGGVATPAHADDGERNVAAPAQAGAELSVARGATVGATHSNPYTAGRAVARERVHGPLYGKYKKRFSKSLNWSNDGCSVPKGAGIPLKIINKYGDFWQNSCDRHDFGYRNHNRIQISRATIDKRFRSNMKYQCDVDNAPGFPEPIAELACKKAADGFYKAVRTFGHRWW